MAEYAKEYCTQNGGNCRACALASYGKDCLNNKITTYLMNPPTGSVDTEENWRADFEDTVPELWGGPAFEDAELIEVYYNTDTAAWEVV